MSQAAVVSIGKKCVLCGVRLDGDLQIAVGLCDSCEHRPEAKRQAPAPRPPAAVPTGNGKRPAPRPFTAADKSLIRSVHALMPAIDLLRTLNTRLIADLGADAPRYTMELLHAEIRSIPQPAAAGDWAGLRRILADARRSGVLAQITDQVIADFAAVFQLAPAQLMHLRDVIRNAKEDR